MSRRQAEQAILDSRVKVNGKVVQQLGSTANPSQDQITLDDQLIELPQERLLILLHKPRQVVTTKSDPQGRTTVMDLLPSEYRVHPVGRLDWDSEGLLLLTNDGELTLKLTHPRYEVQKTYLVTVKGTPSSSTLKQLCSGIELEDGPGKFLSIQILNSSKNETELEVVVSEGRNRFIRRMLDEVLHPVVTLKRIQMGPFELGEIPSGKFKVLDSSEQKALLNKWNV